MKKPLPYARHVTAIQFLPDGSNWKEVCEAMDDMNDYTEPEYEGIPEFLCTPPRGDELHYTDWLIIGEKEFEVLSDTEFNRRYKPA